MQTDRDRLIELIDNFGDDISFCDICKRPREDCDDCTNEQLADYLLANGVIVPPCKVGDTVWRVVTMGTGVKFKKVGYNSWQEKEQTIKHFIRSVIVTKNNFYDIVFGGDFGKTVFLTKEEAEARLKELQNAETKKS